MKRKIAHTEICNYIEANPAAVYLRGLAKIFGYSDYNSLKRLITRTKCLSLERKKLEGNKYRYHVKHDSVAHVAHTVSRKQHGHGGGALGDGDVHVPDVVPLLRKSAKFEDYLDFEVHGVRWISPPSVFVCAADLFVHTRRMWTYCDVNVNIEEGRVMVWTSPGRFEKYGLNRARYAELIKYRDELLRELVGHDVGYALEPIQFDLHQDDHRWEYQGHWQGTNIVEGMAEEYALTVQTYGVVRREHPVAPSSRRIKRFECRFKTRKTVRDMARIIPDVLGLEVDQVRAIANIQSWATHMMSQANAIESAVRYAVPTLLEMPGRVREYMDKHVDGLRTIVQQESEEINANVDILRDELGHSLSTVVNVLEEGNELKREGNARLAHLEDLQQQHMVAQRLQTEWIVQSIDAIREELIEWSSISRVERMEILEEMRLMGMSWRKIAEELGVSHQALHQFFKRNNGSRAVNEYMDNHVDSGGKIEVSHGGTEEIREVDDELMTRIMQTLRQVGGLNSRQLRERIRCNNQKLLDHLRILEYLQVIHGTGGVGRRGITWEVVGHAQVQKSETPISEYAEKRSGGGVHGRD